MSLVWLMKTLTGYSKILFFFSRILQDFSGFWEQFGLLRCVGECSGGPFFILFGFFFGPVSAIFVNSTGCCLFGFVFFLQQWQVPGSLFLPISLALYSFTFPLDLPVLPVQQARPRLTRQCGGTPSRPGQHRGQGLPRRAQHHGEGPAGTGCFPHAGEPSWRIPRLTPVRGLLRFNLT